VRCRLRSDRGAVTVEAAIALSAVILVLAVGIAGIGAVSGSLRCLDAAREAARLVARGDQDRAGEAVRRLAPADAELVVQVSGDEITVTVTAQPVALLAGLRPHAEAYAVLEPEPGGT
jgi:Flp pilus assembly protein TadG